MSDSFRDHYRKEVARYARVPVEQVVFRQRHSYTDPAVFTLEVQGRGLFFAMDVYLEHDEDTFVTPYSDMVRAPSDVHKAYQSTLPV